MNVLVGCEFSGIVREAFRKRGHEAYSCDLEPAEDGSLYHLHGNIRYALDRNNGFYFKALGGHTCWDLAIFHPPCTYLCNSGVRWLYKGGRGTTRDPERWRQLDAAINLLGMLWSASIPRIAIENPIMHRHARQRFGFDPTQIVQPWMFGHPETKATCLWLKNLPLLRPANVVEGRTPRVHYASPSPDRWKVRSRTLQGLAEAMAEQWG